jgi:hypothetical protein
MYVAKHRQKYRQLRTHLHSQMLLSFHLDLNLDLNLYFYPSLHGALLKQLLDTLYQQLFAALFGSMLAALALDFKLLIFDFLGLSVLPPRQPVGRGVGGRIVVWTRPHHYMWCMCCWINAPRMAQSSVLEEPEPEAERISRNRRHTPANVVGNLRSETTSASICVYLRFNAERFIGHPFVSRPSWVHVGSGAQRRT